MIYFVITWKKGKVKWIISNNNIYPIKYHFFLCGTKGTRDVLNDEYLLKFDSGLGTL